MKKAHARHGAAPAPSMRIAVMPKNASETIHITLDTLHGHRVFNARVFFKDVDGKSRPGRGGIAFRVDKLEKFAEAVTSALMAARSNGYIKR